VKYVLIYILMPRCKCKIKNGTGPQCSRQQDGDFCFQHVGCEYVADSTTPPARSILDHINILFSKLGQYTTDIFYSAQEESLKEQYGLPVGEQLSPPARPKTPPARPKTPPARPKTPPARPKTPPARPKTPPARPKTPPARPKTPPATRSILDRINILFAKLDQYVEQYYTTGIFYSVQFNAIKEEIIREKFELPLKEQADVARRYGKFVLVGRDLDWAYKYAETQMPALFASYLKTGEWPDDVYQHHDYYIRIRYKIQPELFRQHRKDNTERLKQQYPKFQGNYFGHSQGGHSQGGHSQGGHSQGGHSQGGQRNTYQAFDAKPQLLKQYGINSKAEYKKWMLTNHPDKVRTPQRAAATELVKKINLAASQMGWIN
jgi:hypothetical protein